MENLKEFDQICKPDGRRISSVILNHQTNEFRRTSLEDLYYWAEKHDLDKNVPDEIRSHFQIARNLFVYSWFFYPFSITAQFYALISIEFALQEFFKDRSPIDISKGWKPKPFPGFRDLIERAVNKGLIKDENFSGVQIDRLFSRANSHLRLKGKPEIQKGKPEIQTYSRALVEALPIIRNDLAHGSGTLNDQGSDFIVIAIEFINQLFSEVVDLAETSERPDQN